MPLIKIRLHGGPLDGETREVTPIDKVDENTFELALFYRFGHLDQEVVSDPVFWNRPVRDSRILTYKRRVGHDYEYVG